MSFQLIPWCFWIPKAPRILNCINIWGAQGIFIFGNTMGYPKNVTVFVFFYKKCFFVVVKNWVVGYQTFKKKFFTIKICLNHFCTKIRLKKWLRFLAFFFTTKFFKNIFSSFYPILMLILYFF